MTRKFCTIYENIENIISKLPDKVWTIFDRIWPVQQNAPLISLFKNAVWFIQCSIVCQMFAHCSVMISQHSVYNTASSLWTLCCIMYYTTPANFHLSITRGALQCKTGRDRSRHLRLWLVERRDRSWFLRRVLDLQRDPGVATPSNAQQHLSSIAKELTK